MARQAAEVLGPLIRRQHEHVPVVVPDEPHLGIQKRTVLAVPDRVVDDQKGRGTVIAMAHRHVAVEGLDALMQPLLGGREKSDVVLGGRQDVARIVRGLEHASPRVWEPAAYEKPKRAATQPRIV